MASPRVTLTAGQNVVAVQPVMTPASATALMSASWLLVSSSVK